MTGTKIVVSKIRMIPQIVLSFPTESRRREGCILYTVVEVFRRNVVKGIGIESVYYSLYLK